MGYDLSGDGTEFNARRGWKDVDVEAVTDAVSPQYDGSHRCLVTWRECAREVARSVRRADPGYEWAVIAVHDDGDYEVTARPE